MVIFKFLWRVRMSLILVFRIQAVIFGIFGLGALLTPALMLGSFGFEITMASANLMQSISLMLIAMAYISWQMPIWASDNLKTVGMFYAVWHVIYMILSGWQISMGVFPGGLGGILNQIAPDLLLAILFFWKSR